MNNTTLVEISKVSLPVEDLGMLKATLFSRNGDEVMVISRDNIIKAKNPIIRIHSQCITGEAFHSLRCDCRPQLMESLKIIYKNKGAIIYLFQEGRGAGLRKKFMANHLEDEGLDTVEAYESLNLPIDQRDYELAADILKYYKISKIKLLTNNPDKIECLEKNGIVISERIPLIIPPNRYNRKYLQTKKSKMRHLL
ncbi:MAG TPA: GTP cyclohydrolase II [Candidatus Dojkabacteria bacterium]|nr:GTP cyclohydrolase II [Candidatus Dojkabacteria bacterium]HRO64984.1 GTP cyclohydrolase II [Candidatus Dojkabacteria bacterium]HRP51809.1 GTP cyclohydrolase II [Candidatus Dojkabacteria bacterium]